MINRIKQYIREEKIYIVLGMFNTSVAFLRLKINKNVDCVNDKSPKGININKTG
jgi:hypothetical protein